MQNPPQNPPVVREADNAQVNLGCEGTLLAASEADGSGEARGEPTTQWSSGTDASASVVPEARNAARGLGRAGMLSIVASCGVEIQRTPYLGVVPRRIEIPRGRLP